MAMKKGRKILGQKRRKAHGTHGVGRWEDSGGCSVAPLTPRCPSDGQTGGHQDRPTSSTNVTFSPLLASSWPDSFSSSPSAHNRSRRYGEGEQARNTRAASQQSKGDVGRTKTSCSGRRSRGWLQLWVRKGSERALPAWDGWGHLGHGASGRCRDSRGQPGSRRALESRGQTIHFPLGKSTPTLVSLVPDLLNICPTL